MERNSTRPSAARGTFQRQRLQAQPAPGLPCVGEVSPSPLPAGCTGSGTCTQRGRVPWPRSRSHSLREPRCASPPEGLKADGPTGPRIHSQFLCLILRMNHDGFLFFFFFLMCLNCCLSCLLAFGLRAMSPGALVSRLRCPGPHATVILPCFPFSPPPAPKAKVNLKVKMSRCKLSSSHLFFFSAEIKVTSAR